MVAGPAAQRGGLTAFLHSLTLVLSPVANKNPTTSLRLTIVCLPAQTKIYGTRCIKMVRRHKSFGVLTQQVQARLWREACEEADLAQELEESLADD